MKAFLLSVAKLGCGLAIALVVLGAAIWGAVTVTQQRRARSEESLAEPKKWPTEKLDAIGGLRLDIATTWEDGQVRYRVRGDSYPEIVARAHDLSGGGARFVLTFEDRHRFKLFEQSIPLSEMSRETDGEKGPVGLWWQGSGFLGADAYRKASFVEVIWSGFPEEHVKAGVASDLRHPKHADKSKWRQLRRGLSKADVRALLGEPTKVQEFSFGTWWHYGNEFTGGKVDFTPAGLVEGWTEP